MLPCHSLRTHTLRTHTLRAALRVLCHHGSPPTYLPPAAKLQHQSQVHRAPSEVPRGAVDEALAELERLAATSEKARAKAAKELAAKAERNRYSQRSLLMNFGKAQAKAGGGTATRWTQNAASDVFGGLPDPLLWQIWSSTGISLVDLLLAVRPVCKRWRDVLGAMPLLRWRVDAAAWLSTTFGRRVVGDTLRCDTQAPRTSDAVVNPAARYWTHVEWSWSRFVATLQQGMCGFHETRARKCRFFIPFV